MVSGDLFTSLFEAGAAIMLSRNVWLTYSAGTVKGVSILSTAFFNVWGVYNLWYYPSLGQRFSFYAGLAVASVNFIWVVQMIYLRRKDASRSLVARDAEFEPSFVEG